MLSLHLTVVNLRDPRRFRRQPRRLNEMIEWYDIDYLLVYLLMSTCN